MRLIYEKWKKLYQNELNELWNIFYKIFCEYHVRDGDWNSESNKEKFWRFVYIKSSRSINEIHI